ncbi:MAG: hypothetical protein QNK35_03825 [Bacteroides sp.]|nr:hypothetical protein [Bacteroides sp.]
MEMTPEIEEIFASRAEEITSLELTYKNGGKVIGTIRKRRLSPLRLVLQKSAPEKGERPRHKVVFDHVTLLQINFEDGSEVVFQ